MIPEQQVTLPKKMVEQSTPPKKVPSGTNVPIPEGQPNTNQSYLEQSTRDETVIMIDTSKDSGNNSKKTSKKQ